MRHSQTAARAADLAERIVDEISQANQDWPAIELRARELVEVVAEPASGSALRYGGTGARRIADTFEHNHANADN